MRESSEERVRRMCMNISKSQKADSFVMSFEGRCNEYEYCMNLLKKTAGVLPTEEQEQRYLEVVDKMEKSCVRTENGDNVTTTMEAADLMILAKSLMDFLFEADSVLNLCAQT